MDIRPNHTIYINNVNDKIKKEGKLQVFICFYFHSFGTLVLASSYRRAYFGFTAIYCDFNTLALLLWTLSLLLNHNIDCD